jgi:lipopolysaccharide export system protein LptC
VSEAATRDRAFRQRWAIPGSSHDRLVRIARILLPAAIGVLLVFLALAPLRKEGDVSFILDKNQVDNAPERMRVEEARYVGQDNQGQPFVIVARQAIQRSSDEPIVDISDILGRLGLAQGPATIAAAKARYDIDDQLMMVDGAVRVTGPDQYRLVTRDVTINLKNRTLAGDGGVEGEMRLGRFQAGRVRADLGERTVVLDRGARLKIVQGAVR